MEFILLSKESTQIRYVVCIPFDGNKLPEIIAVVVFVALIKEFPVLERS